MLEAKAAASFQTWNYNLISASWRQKYHKMANPLQAMRGQDYMEDLLGNKLGPIKPALSHLGLYFGLCVYTAIGAKVSPISFSHISATFSHLGL